MAAKHNNPAEQSDAERELTNGRKDTAAEDLENAEDHCYGEGCLDDGGITKIFIDGALYLLPNYQPLFDNGLMRKDRLGSKS